MRVLSWNTSWNCSPDRIVRQIEAVGELEADVAFFSEWSPQPYRTTASGKRIHNSHHVRSEQLEVIGLGHQEYEHASDYADRSDGRWAGLYWGVLAASRRPLRKVAVDNPTFSPGSWLEVEVEESDMRLVSVRVPAWEGPEFGLRRSLWEWMVEQFDRLSNTPAIVLGDFNTESSYRSAKLARGHGADLMGLVTNDLGWCDLAAVTGRDTPTFARKNGAAARLDYSFVSPALGSDSVGFSAPTRVGRHHLVGEKSCAPLSDHTPVVVDFESRAVATASA